MLYLHESWLCKEAPRLCTYNGAKIGIGLSQDTPLARRVKKIKVRSGFEPETFCV